MITTKSLLKKKRKNKNGLRAALTIMSTKFKCI